MKINCIYLGKLPFTVDNPEKILLDGTHTEGFYMANILERYSHCIVFCSIENRMFNSNGVEFINCNEFDEYIKYYNFDNVFLMNDITDKLIRMIKCGRLYLMPSCESLGGVVTEENLSYIYKICYLSEHQKETLILSCGDFLRNNQSIFMKWFNAIDETLYEDVNYSDKTNSMIWSSTAIRGFDWVKDRILPSILKEIPDFKLYLCGYLNNGKTYETNDNVVIYLGKLDKAELSKYQKQAKIWIYPNLGIVQNFVYFNETFCNTAVENALAENAIVCLNKGGLSSTLYRYSGLIDGDIFNEKGVMYPSDFERVFNEFIKQTIRILKDDEYRKKLTLELVNIGNKYTLKSFEDFWVKELNLNFR